MLLARLTFGMGPAGTGKTSCRWRVQSRCCNRKRCGGSCWRVLLLRRASGLVFLPGDLSKKVDPYLRPTMTRQNETLGFERVWSKSIQRNVIEVAPLAFMRGSNAYDLFRDSDEVQSTRDEDMPMFWTRNIWPRVEGRGHGPDHQGPSVVSKQSGLRTVMDVLRGVRGIAFDLFSSRDAVRHPSGGRGLFKATKRIRRPTACCSRALEPGRRDCSKSM